MMSAAWVVSGRWEGSGSARFREATASLPGFTALQDTHTQTDGQVLWHEMTSFIPI